MSTDSEVDKVAEKKRSSVSVNIEQLDAIKLLAMANDMQVGDMACILMGQALAPYEDEIRVIRELKDRLKFKAE